MEKVPAKNDYLPRSYKDVWLRWLSDYNRADYRTNPNRDAGGHWLSLAGEGALSFQAGKAEGRALVTKQQDITSTVTEILSLHRRVERAMEVLRTKFNEADQLVDDLARYSSPDYWRLVAITDGIGKVLYISSSKTFNTLKPLGFWRLRATCSNY